MEWNSAFFSISWKQHKMQKTRNHELIIIHRTSCGGLSFVYMYLHICAPPLYVRIQSCWS